MDNVIRFPKENKNLASLEYNVAQQKLIDENIIEDIAAGIISIVAKELLKNNIELDLESDLVRKCLVFSHETICALIYSSLELEHPMHEIIENIISDMPPPPYEENENDT